MSGDILWDDHIAKEIIPVFKLANYWIASHAYPMNRLRSELTGKIKKCRIDGITVGRLKSMRSIRRKLKSKPEGLHQIQDLGGCRSIVSSITQATELVEAQKSTSYHNLIHEDNYIQSPKNDGYRSHHLIYEYKGIDADDVLNGRRIEIQVRTRLQHAWATAVEAVGLFRNENLKAGEGDADWLRLFLLMSSEFAHAECSPEPPGPARSDRVDEIRELEQKMDASNILNGIRDAVRYTELYMDDPLSPPKHYLVTYHHQSHKVTAKPYYPPFEDRLNLGVANFEDEIDHSESITSIIVEADKVKILKEAFPNYFGDVSVFSANLRNIVKGRNAQEYLMPPQQTIVSAAETKADPRWLRPGRSRRWE